MIGATSEALIQQLGVFMAIHNQQNQHPYGLGDEDPQSDDFEEIPNRGAEIIFVMRRKEGMMIG